MRPVRLEMKGFSTFRDETVVDFADVELFALVGSTGSGKSSVIDAMTFALYGSAARYDEKLVAPVINQMSTEARVRFTFEVAGVVYVATRIVRRTAKGATTKEARFERDGALVAGDAKQLTAEVEKLLGLDFQRFNKTVVLPQGKFAEFLHDSPAVRQELLRELLGFGMYEQLGQLARARAATCKNEATVLERGLEELGDLSDERLAAAETHVAAVGVARKDVAAAAVELATAQTEIAAIDRDLGDLTRQLELLEAVEVPGDVAELTDALAAATDAERVAAAKREEARVALRGANDAVAGGPDIAACRRLLDAHQQASALRARAAEATVRVAAATTQVSTASVDADRVRAEIEAAQAVCAKLRGQRDVAEQALREAGDGRALATLLGKIDQRAAFADELTVRRARQEAVAGELDVATLRLEAAREQLAHLERRAPAAALAAHLHVGSTCPVCEQVVSQLPAPREADDDELKRAREEVAAAEASTAHAGKAHAGVTAVIADMEKSHQELDAELEGQPDRDEVEALMRAQSAVYVVALEARQDVIDAEAAVESLTADPAKRQVLEAEKQAHMELTRQQALEAQTTADLAALETSLGGKRSEPEAQADLERAEALVAARQAAQTIEQSADDQHAATRRALDAAERAEADARLHYAAARESLVALRPPKPAGTLALDWEALTTWCQGTTQALVDRRREVDTARSTLAASQDALLAAIRSIAQPFVGDSNAPVDDLRTDLAAAEATAKGVLEQLQRDRARVEKTMRQVEKLRADAEVADMLGNLLRANQFQRWLLEEAMQDLVERATVRLHDLTAGQYSLTTEDGTFRIVDHRNADEVRDARSLSGGETFLTSLSLALALADSSIDLAAEGAAPMESIFLDEGFGTLDPDTLEVVAGTIEELGATGRMVGIVTHIRDLAERMPTRLEVSKSASGSTVQRVDV